VTVFSNGKKAAKHDLRHEAQFLSWIYGFNVSHMLMVPPLPSAGTENEWANILNDAHQCSLACGLLTRKTSLKL
jgi:hypothetical protein